MPGALELASDLMLGSVPLHIWTCSPLWSALQENSELRVGWVSSSWIRAVTFTSVSPRGGPLLHDFMTGKAANSRGSCSFPTEHGVRFVPIDFVHSISKNGESGLNHHYSYFFFFATAIL